MEWETYNKERAKSGPSELLEEALKYLKDKEGNREALDLGAGLLIDSGEMVERGYHVTAIDPDEISVERSREIDSESFDHKGGVTIEDFDFKEEEYDLINAQQVLHLLPSREVAVDVIQKIVKSLKPGGVFTCTLLGNKHQSRGKVVRFEYEDVAELFHGLDFIKFDVIDEKRESSLGNMKDWHSYKIIVKKLE